MYTVLFYIKEQVTSCLVSLACHFIYELPGNIGVLSTQGSGTCVEMTSLLLHYIFPVIINNTYINVFTENSLLNRQREKIKGSLTRSVLLTSPVSQGNKRDIQWESGKILVPGKTKTDKLKSNRNIFRNGHICM